MFIAKKLRQQLSKVSFKPNDRKYRPTVIPSHLKVILYIVSTDYITLSFNINITDRQKITFSFTINGKFFLIVGFVIAD
jgi:hypothetical protein